MSAREHPHCHEPHVSEHLAIAALVGRYVERRERGGAPCAHDLIPVASESGEAAVEHLRTVLIFFEAMRSSEIWVVWGLSWPSQSAITVMSLPALSRRIAAVWRSVCGEIVLACSDAQASAAVVTCLASSQATASRLRRPPRLVGNSGSAGLPGAFVLPDAQHCGGLSGQRGDALFAAFAVAVQVRSAGERDVGAVQAGQLGDAQSGLDHGQ
jgi:hypothetical protein